MSTKHFSSVQCLQVASQISRWCAKRCHTPKLGETWEWGYYSSLILRSFQPSSKVFNCFKHVLLYSKQDILEDAHHRMVMCMNLRITEKRRVFIQRGYHSVYSACLLLSAVCCVASISGSSLYSCVTYQVYCTIPLPYRMGFKLGRSLGVQCVVIASIPGSSLVNCVTYQL